MKRASTQLFEGLGAIKQVIKQFGTIANDLTGGQIASTTLDPTNAILENIDTPLSRESINGGKYDLIKGIFDKHVQNEQLSIAYTLLALDALQKFNLSFDELFSNKEDNISFSTLGIAVLNNYRPSTSQIGVKQTVTAIPNVARHIIQ